MQLILNKLDWENGVKPTQVISTSESAFPMISQFPIEHQVCC